MRQRYLCLLFLLLSLPVLPLSAQAQPGFQIAIPPGWIDVRENLAQDQLKLVLEPEQNAFYEVYAAKVENRGLHALADGWVDHLRKRLGGDLETLECSTMIALQGRPAILRRYSGADKGIPSGAVILVTYRGGTAWFVIGMWRTDGPSKEEQVTLAVTSIEFAD